MGGGMFWMEGIVSWGYELCPCMSEGSPVWRAGEEEAEAILGPTEDLEVDFCLVSCGGC